MKNKIFKILIIAVLVCSIALLLVACDYNKKDKGGDTGTAETKAPTVADVYDMLAAGTDISPTNKDKYNIETRMTAAIDVAKTASNEAYKKNLDIVFKLSVDKATKNLTADTASYDNRLFLQVKDGNNIVFGMYYDECKPTGAAGENLLYVEFLDDNNQSKKFGINAYSYKKALLAKAQSNSDKTDSFLDFETIMSTMGSSVFSAIFSPKKTDTGISADGKTAFITMELADLINTYIPLLSLDAFKGDIDSILSAANLNLTVDMLQGIKSAGVKAVFTFSFDDNKMLANTNIKFSVDESINVLLEKTNGVDAEGNKIIGRFIDTHIPKMTADINVNYFAVSSELGRATDAEMEALGLESYIVTNAINYDMKGVAQLTKTVESGREVVSSYDYELTANINPCVLVEGLSVDNFKKLGVFNFMLKDTNSSVVLQFTFDPAVSGDDAIYVYAAFNGNTFSTKYSLSDLVKLQSLNNKSESVTPPAGGSIDIPTLIQGFLKQAKGYAQQLGKVISLFDFELAAENNISFNVSAFETLLGGNSDLFTAIFGDSDFLTLKTDKENSSYGTVGDDYTAFANIKQLATFTASVTAIDNVKTQYTVGEKLELTQEVLPAEGDVAPLYIASLQKTFTADVEATADMLKGYVIAFTTNFDGSKVGEYSVTLFVSDRFDEAAKVQAQKGMPVGLYSITYKVTVAAAQV